MYMFEMKTDLNVYTLVSLDGIQHRHSLWPIVGALLRSVLTDKQLYSWGWRIPFLSGILIAFVGVYLRMYGKDMDTWKGGYSLERCF
jgi:hypothetical protein